HFDPSSTTDTLKLNERDVTYSVYRPDLAALGAIDGRPGSGRPQDNDDALSRRDMGIEFLDVTAQVESRRVDSRLFLGGLVRVDPYRMTNHSPSVVDTHLLVVAEGLPDRVRMINASGITSGGDPYLRVFLPDGVLSPGQSITRQLVFLRSPRAPAASYSLGLLSGQGNP